MLPYFFRIRNSACNKMMDVILLFAICIILTLDPTAVPKNLRKYYGYYESKDICDNSRYSIVFDAGSTGSRVHVYQFCKELKDEIFVQSKPGLSTLGPEKGSDSLVDLLQIAVDSIPREHQRCTPIQLQATAGLRLLPDNGIAIITSIQKLFSYYPFLVLQIQVMSGLDEALFAWLTVNYLADNFKNTAAIIDLGGASTQIVFEHIDYTTKYSYLKDYSLYSNSFLGFGLHEALDTIRDTLGVSENPCLDKDQKDHYVKNGKDIVFHGPNKSEDRSKLCREMVHRKLFLQHDTCDEEEKAPCRMNLHFPDISTFKNDIYAFSYIYDLTHLPGMTIKDNPKISEIIALQKAFCDFSKNANIIDKIEELRVKEPLGCMQISYIVELLTTGYGLNEERELKVVKKLKNIEMGWSLGAAVKSLDEIKSCKRQ